MPADGLSPAPEPSGALPDDVQAARARASLGISAEDELAGPDCSSERVTIYWTLFLLLLGGSLLIGGDTLWATNASIHTMMEAIATLLAFIIGALALVRFYSRKRATFLYIGTGFLGAGLLDLNHALSTSDYFIGAAPNAPELFAWTWTSERVFLSLFLAVSVLAWRQEERGQEVTGEFSVFATAVALTVINLLFFAYVPLTQAIFPGLPIDRPAELLPGMFFALAAVGFLYKGGWRRDAFEHWLVISLVISVLCHVAFMAQSGQRYDAMFDVAHMLKIASYFAILTGLLSSVYLTFTREGRVLRALTDSNEALAHEIEVRAQTEQAVKESSARLQDFLDNANDLIQSVDPTGKFLYVNSSWKGVLGYADEDLDDLNFFDILNPVKRPHLEEQFRRALAGEGAQRFTVEYLASDGRIVVLSGSAQAQYVNGVAVATQGIFRDVTEQRIAERQLAESRANLGALVESTGDTIWSVDREQRLITFNSAFALEVEAQSGKEPKVGGLAADMHRPEDVEWYRDLYSKTLDGDRHVLLRTDESGGRERHFEVYANPIQAFEGVSGAVFFGKDVTPRVRAEEALRVAKEEAVAANKAKSDFLANMSHELRTPLNSIIGFTNILLKNKDERLNEKDLGFLTRVTSNGKHLLALINEVLDLAKVEAGRMELIIEEIDLAHLCVETVQQLEGQAKAKEGDIALIADVPDAVEFVETDSSKLKQVIINLVGNALKFTHEGSVTVRLETASDGKTPTAISVVDTGIGIPADRLEAIFEAFQQAEIGTSRKYGGTGLGLALSRSICLLMGYELIVESEEGKGSTFKIVMGERAKRPEKADEAGSDALPESRGPTEAVEVSSGAEASDGVAASEDGTVAEPRTGVAATMRDFQVLVVDDEKDSRVLMAHYLEEFGCRVITAVGGEEGIALAHKHKPDLITLDLMMPDMTGWEVLKRLKADPDVKHIPVVIVSIVAGEGRGRLLGAVDLVTKPFEREDLLRVLWRNLVRKRGGRVLVVDDEADMRTMLTEYLSKVGLETVSATNGKDGLEKVRSEAPDAVILDLMMPVMSGLEFLEKLRKDPLHTGLPVFVLTGKVVTDAESETLGELASAVLLKKDALEHLGELLGSIFNLTDTQSRAE